MRDGTHSWQPRTNWMFIRSFLWGFSSCTRGWSDCVGSRHLFFQSIIKTLPSCVILFLHHLEEADYSWILILCSTALSFLLFFLTFSSPPPNTNTFHNRFSLTLMGTRRSCENAQQRNQKLGRKTTTSAKIVWLKEELTYIEVTNAGTDTWILCHL